jgi:Nucleotidyl transferase AbiEii toxin, Type IV TA system
MSRKKLINSAASIRQKLLNISRQTKQPFSEIIHYYAMERFIFRLTHSVYSKHFILKGGLLLRAWNINAFRTTMDIDLLGLSSNGAEMLKTQFSDICDLKVEEDGLIFDKNSIRLIPITEGADYVGQRITFWALLDSAQIKMQVDVGFGDVVFPDPVEYSLPNLLNLSITNITCYRPETTIAEKFDAMVKLGMANSRMKDFYDIWLIMRELEIDIAVLGQAIQKTFRTRATPLPALKDIIAFSPLFYHDTNKNIQWKAFLKKKLIPQQKLQLPDVCNEISEQLEEVIVQIRSCE